LRISTLARVSRNKRLLAIKNTDRGQLFTRPLHSEAVVTDRHNWITPTGATIPYKKGCMPVLEYYSLIIILRLPSSILVPKREKQRSWGFGLLFFWRASDQPALKERPLFPSAPPV
jgi:hypothetical protein